LRVRSCLVVELVPGRLARGHLEHCTGEGPYVGLLPRDLHSLVTHDFGGHPAGRACDFATLLRQVRIRAGNNSASPMLARTEICELYDAIVTDEAVRAFDISVAAIARRAARSLTQSFV
jgi:hypothetical protein